MIIVQGISEQEDFHRPEIPLEKTREIDNEARISKKAEIKRKFNRNQKRITSWDIQLSRLTSLLETSAIFDITQTHNHLVRKRTLNHSAKLTKWFRKLICMVHWLCVLSCHILVQSESKWLCVLVRWQNYFSKISRSDNFISY